MKPFGKNWNVLFFQKKVDLGTKFTLVKKGKISNGAENSLEI